MRALTPILAVFALAAPLGLGSSALADDAGDAWRELAEWMRSDRPDKPTAAAMKSYRRKVADRLEAYIEAYPKSSNRRSAERVLGETYIAQKSYSKALKLYDGLAEDEADPRRRELGRAGGLRVLCAQVRVSEARRRLNRYLKDEPDSETWHEFDAFLLDYEKRGKNKDKFRKLKTGRAFPEFTGKLISDGSTWDLTEKRGKLTLIGFWMGRTDQGKLIKTTSREVPIVQKLHEEFGERGLTVIGIAIDRDREQLKDFLERNKITFPQLANAREVFNELGVPAVPTWILLNGQGRILRKNLRYNTMEKTVRQYMKAAGVQ